MIRINLLPFRSVRKKENIKNQAIVYLISIFVVLAPLYWYHGKLKNQIVNLGENIANTERELKRQEQKAKQVDEYTAKLDELKKKMAVVSTLEKGRRSIYYLLLDVTDEIVPTKMWFTRLNVSEKASKEGNKNLSTTHVSIDGIAFDDQTVANYMKNLQRLDRFAAVSLVVSETAPVTKTMALKKFSLQCVEKPIVVSESAPPPTRPRAAKK